MLANPIGPNPVIDLFELLGTCHRVQACIEAIGDPEFATLRVGGNSFAVSDKLLAEQLFMKAGELIEGIHHLLDSAVMSGLEEADAALAV